MLQKIADHISDKAPAYIVAMFVAGMGVFTSGIFAYSDFKYWQRSVDDRLNWRAEQQEWNRKTEASFDRLESRITFLMLEGGHISPEDLIKDPEEDDD